VSRIFRSASFFTYSCAVSFGEIVILDFDDYGACGPMSKFNVNVKKCSLELRVTMTWSVRVLRRHHEHPTASKPSKE
jgi:hypothetical protein